MIGTETGFAAYLALDRACERNNQPAFTQQERYRLVTRRPWVHSYHNEGEGLPWWRATVGDPIPLTRLEGESHA